MIVPGTTILSKYLVWIFNTKICFNFLLVESICNLSFNQTDIVPIVRVKSTSVVTIVTSLH